MSILSRLACEWAVRAFGRDHVANAPVRALRILEEAVELCQAFKVPPEKVAACVEIVYSRPPGDPVQELGGVLLTTNILCAALGNIEPDDLLEMELARVLAKSPEHFAKRNLEKIDVPAQDNTAPKNAETGEIFYEPSTNKSYRVGPNGEKYELPPGDRGQA